MRLRELILIISVVLIIFLSSNEVKAPTETSNATFAITNSVPQIIDVRVTTNATRVTNTNYEPTNVTRFVNFTVFWRDANANSVTILVCKTNSASANGCSDASYFINQTTFATTNRSALNKTTLNLGTYKAHIDAKNNTIAYLFLSDGSGVSTSRNVSFSVNHAPTIGTPGIVGQNSASNYTNETYTAGVRSLYDVDHSNSSVFTNFTVTYKWFRQAGGTGTWTDPSISTQTLNCGTASCNEADKIRVQLSVIDHHGYSNSSSGPKNSSNLTIANSPPLPPSNFRVKDGTGTWDGAGIFDTHANNNTGPEIIYKNGSDPDGDLTKVFVCARSNPPENITSVGACSNNVFNVTGKSATAGNSSYNRHSIGSLKYAPSTSLNTTYIVLISTDGTANSSILNITLYLNNSKPTVSDNTMNVSSTHDQSPAIRWTSTDADDGRVDGWPADTLQNFVRVTSLGSGGTTLNSSNKARNNSYIIFPNIAWNTTVSNVSGKNYWSNRTVFFKTWTNDSTGTTYGNSSLETDNFTLYDYLPRIVHINMSNNLAAAPYLSCLKNTSTCQLTPVEFSNTSVAVKITIDDRDADCSTTNHKAFITLCINQTTSARCDENNDNDYRFALASVVSASNSSRCFFSRTSNASGANTPEFFRNNTNYKLHVNISNNNSVKRDNDALVNGTWTYTGLNAANFSTAVTLGNGSVRIGGTVRVWSYGSNKYVLKNYGNLNVTLQWNMSDPIRSGGTQKWPLNGTDAKVDDDNNVSLETEGRIPPTNLTKNKSPGFFFHPLGREQLSHCLTQNCSLNSLNETLNAYFHILPPINLTTAGTYISTIWITSTS